MVFRKPTGKDRLQRRFLKTDLIGKLYDFIDVTNAEDNNVGFEVLEGQDEIDYELVTPPTPSIKRLTDRSKTLEEEGINRSTLLNIKQLTS